MEPRFVYIEIEHEEPVALPIALLNQNPPHVTLKTMTDAGDPNPRTFTLRAGDGGVLMLMEIDIPTTPTGDSHVER